MLIGSLALSSNVAAAMGFPRLALLLQGATGSLFAFRTLRRGFFWQDAPSVLGVALSVGGAPAALHWSFVVVGAALSVLLPPEHASLFRPRGPHAVGTCDGVYGANKQHLRVWYPASARGTAPTSYFARDLPHVRGMANFVGIPVQLFAHLKLVETHTFVDAPYAVGVARKPLILFSHGLGGVRSTYSSLCAEFASHGYVVVAVEHQDSTASVTKGPDGQVQWYQRPTPEQIAKNDNFEMRHAQLLHRRQEVAALLDFVRGTARDDDGAAIKAVRALADTARVHIAGHSFGGATSIDCAAALTSHNVLSAAALDSWAHPLGDAERKSSLTIPVLMLNTDLFQWKETVAIMQELCERAAAPCAVGFVPHTGHQSVSDFPLFLRLVMRLQRHTGPIDPVVALGLYADACLALFRFAETPAPSKGHFVDLLEPGRFTIQFRNT